MVISILLDFFEVRQPLMTHQCKEVLALVFVDE